MIKNATSFGKRVSQRGPGREEVVGRSRGWRPDGRAAMGGGDAPGGGRRRGSGVPEGSGERSVPSRPGFF